MQMRVVCGTSCGNTNAGCFSATGIFLGKINILFYFTLPIVILSPSEKKTGIEAAVLSNETPENSNQLNIRLQDLRFCMRNFDAGYERKICLH